MLTTIQMDAIEKLQKRCEQEDGIQLKLNWDMLRQRNTGEMDFFLWQDEELIAFLGLYGFGSTVELCGMVLPEKRRLGIFTTLWGEALLFIREKGYKKILLNAPGSSDSAKAWLAGLPCEYSFSEYQMQWKQTVITPSDEIVMRDATSSDADFEIHLDMSAFNLSEEDAREHYNRVIDRPDENHFIIEKDSQRIGKIGVSKDNGEAYIYGFAVVPEFQGRGYGGKALRNTVSLLNDSSHSIQLDVETKNENALKLYENVGFTSVQRQDYYVYE